MIFSHRPSSLLEICCWLEIYYPTIEASGVTLQVVRPWSSLKLIYKAILSIRGCLISIRAEIHDFILFSLGFFCYPRRQLEYPPCTQTNGLMAVGFHVTCGVSVLGNLSARRWDGSVIVRAILSHQCPPTLWQSFELCERCCLAASGLWLVCHKQKAGCTLLLQPAAHLL